MQADRQTLRQAFREKRHALSGAQQNEAAELIVTVCQQTKSFNEADKVALYLANDGELNPALLIKQLWMQNKQVYLPVLHPFSKGNLVFVHYHADSTMKPNRFGILEPVLACQALCPIAELDIICAPLVAFDKQCNRMGMGGGFYDRTLAPILRDKLDVEVVGLAHDCQLTESLCVENWDIPLSRIITPSKVFSSRL